MRISTKSDQIISEQNDSEQKYMNNNNKHVNCQL